MASRIQGITVEIGGDTTKLSKALESVNKSIKGTQSGLKDVNKLLKLDPSNTELVVQKQKMLKDAIEATKEKLATLKTAAQQANEQLANGEITQQQYDALQREIAETEQNLRSLQDQAATTNATLAKIDEVGEKLQNIGSSVENVGKKFLPVTAAVTGLGTAAVKTAADFDSEMSKVSAISGATGDDFDQLRAKAREMGAKTKFSASEAASAMEYMAMAGWKTSDMLNGIEGIMNLAAASGEDLATTSDIVTDALTAFGLSAADSGHFADILAAASSNANTNVSIATSNADGSMRSLNDILADCRVAFSGLSESEKAANAEALVGKNAMSGFLALMNSSETDINKLRGAIENCDGASESMAETMQDNLNGQLTILKSQLEELAISFGDILMPTIRKIVSAVQQFVDKLNSMDESTRETIIKIGLLAASIGPLLIVLGKTISTVGTAMRGFRNCLGGMAGSVLDVFGGEFEWDRYTVKFHKARGADHNVHIIYGKNLTDFKMEKSIENTITGVHPYWVDNETQAVMELPEKVVLQSKRSIPYQKITVLDCTSNFQEKPSAAALREYAQNYIDTTDLTEPEIDIKIDFLQLWNTPGYEDIVEAERVSLCDTVHVFISKLGIEVSSKVTETEYDTLLERYNSITLSNSTVSSRNSSLTGSLNSIRNTATIAYDTAVRAETAVGEQVGGITASIIYDGALFAALFGLHYKNETDSKGNTTRYAFNAATLKQSTVAWKNSSAGLFVSTDGGKTWGYGWESDDTAVETAILLEQNLKELDDRYKKATELSEELLKELDDRYKTATVLSSELQEQLDQRYETAKKLSKELAEELDRRYGNVTTLSEALQKELDERYSVAKKLSEDVEKELDKKYQPSIPVSETAPEEPGNDALWVDKKNLRLKLWDGENWRTVGYEPEDPKEPEKPVEPEEPDNTGQGGGESDGSKEETDSGNTDTGSTGDGSDNSETSQDLSGD